MLGVFEIEEMKVRGQFCLLAFKLYCENKKIGLEQLGNKLFANETVNFFELIDLMYFSCKAYSYLHNTEFSKSQHEFTNDFSLVTEQTIAESTNKLLEVKLFGKSLLAPEVNSKVDADKKK